MNSDVKIIVELIPKLEQYEDETLWAEPLGDGKYKIANIPMFVNNLNFLDIVRCEGELNGFPKIVEVLERSGQETLRLGVVPQTPEIMRDQIFDAVKKHCHLLERWNSNLCTFTFPSWHDLTKAVDAIRLIEGVHEFIWCETAYNDESPFFDPELNARP